MSGTPNQANVRAQLQTQLKHQADEIRALKHLCSTLKIRYRDIPATIKQTEDNSLVSESHRAICALELTDINAPVAQISGMRAWLNYARDEVFRQIEDRNFLTAQQQLETIVAVLHQTKGYVENVGVALLAHENAQVTLNLRERYMGFTQALLALDARFNELNQAYRAVHPAVLDNPFMRRPCLGEFGRGDDEFGDGSNLQTYTAMRSRLQDTTSAAFDALSCGDHGTAMSALMKADMQMTEIEQRLLELTNVVEVHVAMEQRTLGPKAELLFPIDDEGPIPEHYRPLANTPRAYETGDVMVGLQIHAETMFKSSSGLGFAPKVPPGFESFNYETHPYGPLYPPANGTPPIPTSPDRRVVEEWLVNVQTSGPEYNNLPEIKMNGGHRNLPPPLHILKRSRADSTMEQQPPKQQPNRSSRIPIAVGPPRTAPPLPPRPARSPPQATTKPVSFLPNPSPSPAAPLPKVKKSIPKATDQEAESDSTFAAAIDAGQSKVEWFIDHLPDNTAEYTDIVRQSARGMRMAWRSREDY